MKLVFKILLFTLIIKGVSGCQSPSTVNYANELQTCLEPAHIKLLNSLSAKFERHLTNTYDLNLADSYKKYLRSVATGSFSPNFFKYSKFEEDMQIFRNSDFYQRSWAKSSSFDEEAVIEVPPTVVNEENRRQEVYDPIVLDPTSKYIQCLIDKNDSKALKDYLDVVKAGVEIHPGLVAHALYENLSTEELNDGLTRLIIAINFHYQIGLLLTEKEKIS